MAYYVGLSHIDDDAGIKLSGGRFYLEIIDKDGKPQTLEMPINILPDQNFKVVLAAILDNFEKEINAL